MAIGPSVVKFPPPEIETLPLFIVQLLSDDVTVPFDIPKLLPPEFQRNLPWYISMSHLSTAFTIERSGRGDVR